MLLKHDFDCRVVFMAEILIEDSRQGIAFYDVCEVGDSCREMRFNVGPYLSIDTFGVDQHTVKVEKGAGGSIHCRIFSR